jgi:hypothetical protein
MQPSRPKIKIRDRIKPAGGIAPLLHVVFRLALPVAVFVLSSLDISIWLPLLVVLLSKWRIFAVRYRFWPANIRANAVDIIFGVSMVIFMADTDNLLARFIIAVVYALWLLLLKPRSSILATSIQAGVAQFVGLMAVFVAWPDVSILGLVLVVGLISYLSARHFFDSFNEPYARMLSYLWGYFGSALIWVLGHLLVVYPKPDGVITQPTILLSVIGYTLGAIYYLEHFDRLSKTVRSELLYVSAGIIVILLISLLYEGMHLIV